jgi:hypothetical protein
VGERVLQAADLEGRFNSILVKSIEESFAASLGRDASSAEHVYAFLGLSREEIAAHMEALFIGLRELFGVSGEVLGRRIVRKLYAELGLSLVQKPNCSLVGYVEDARRLFRRNNGAASKLG